MQFVKLRWGKLRLSYKNKKKSTKRAEELKIKIKPFLILNYNQKLCCILVLSIIVLAVIAIPVALKCKFKILNIKKIHLLLVAKK